MTKINKEALLDCLEGYKRLGYNYIDPIVIPSVKYITQLHELPQEIDLLKKHIDNCNLCPLSNNKDNFEKKLYDHNSIMSLFLSPNILEDQAKAELFKKIVQNVLKIDIKDISISYAIQCHTSTRISIQECSNSCKTYLFKEIALLKPKVILMFGDVYNIFFDTNEDIVKISGSIIKYQNSIVVPLVGLEFIQKNPSYKKRLFIDLLKVKNILENL